MSAPSQNPNGGNPFSSSGSAPSVTFEVGTSRVMQVVGWPEFKQGRDFQTKQLEFWPDGKPKMIIMVPVEIDGAALTLWVTPGTAMFAAIEAAQQAVGHEIAPGGTLNVTCTHTVPSSKGAGFNPVKQYAATFAPAGAFSTPTPDAFAAAQAPVSAPAAAPAPAPAPAAPAPAAPAPASNGNGTKVLSAEQFAALAAAGVDMSAFTVGV